MQKYLDDILYFSGTGFIALGLFCSPLPWTGFIAIGISFVFVGWKTAQSRAQAQTQAGEQ